MMKAERAFYLGLCGSAGRRRRRKVDEDDKKKGQKGIFP